MFKKLREFFAEAKSEFKKISWPTLDEVKGSTAVVGVTILCVMALLAVYDLGILGLKDVAKMILGK
jgi:preprotein translocase SecE subunit